MVVLLTSRLTNNYHALLVMWCWLSSIISICVLQNIVYGDHNITRSPGGFGNTKSHSCRQTTIYSYIKLFRNIKMLNARSDHILDVVQWSCHKQESTMVRMPWCVKSLEVQLGFMTWHNLRGYTKVLEGIVGHRLVFMSRPLVPSKSCILRVRPCM